MNIKLFFLSIVILSSFIGCKTSIPDGVIPPNKMILILEDLHLTDALIAKEQLKKKIKTDSLQGYYNYIYKKHKFNKEQFEHTLMFYAQNPEILQEAYKGVLAGLEKRDSIAKSHRQVKVDTIELWKGISNLTVEKYTNETLSFKIPAFYPNTYYISADIKVFDDSQIRDFTPIFGFLAKDTIYSFNAEKIKSDTIFQSIRWKQMATDTTVTHLVGNFAPQADSTEIFKHYEIKNIRIYTTTTDTENIKNNRLIIK